MSKITCDSCGKEKCNPPKWEHDGKQYCSVGCAVWDGWNPMDARRCVSHKTREADKATYLEPMKPYKPERKNEPIILPRGFA
jgi:hypothetical protein